MIICLEPGTVSHGLQKALCKWLKAGVLEEVIQPCAWTLLPFVGSSWCSQPSVGGQFFRWFWTPIQSWIGFQIFIIYQKPHFQPLLPSLWANDSNTYFSAENEVTPVKWRLHSRTLCWVQVDVLQTVTPPTMLWSGTASWLGVLGSGNPLPMTLHLTVLLLAHYGTVCSQVLYSMSQT